MINAEYDYYIAKDSFTIYFPEDNYDVNLLWDWYTIMPTEPQAVAYYGDNIELVKRHFEQFTNFDDIKTRMGNNLHAEPFLTVNVFVIYNYQGELQGFAAQEWMSGFGADRKFLYCREFIED